MGVREKLELSLTLGLGVANVATEIAGKGKVAVLLAGLCAWSWLLSWRQKQEPGFWRGFLRFPRAWGWPVSALTVGTGLGVAFCAVAGAKTGQLRWDGSHWLMLGLYPSWGLAQQFLLNEVLARHLRAWSPRLGGGLAAALFALAHAPDWGVAAAVFPAAFFWIWLYPKLRSLPLFAAAHGVVGTTFFAWVQGRSLAEALALTLS